MHKLQTALLGRLERFEVPVQGPVSGLLSGVHVMVKISGLFVRVFVCVSCVCVCVCVYVVSRWSQEFKIAGGAMQALPNEGTVSA